jgi:membrane-anchored protein YejM (alkaline phosphatase superfamily)
MQVSVPQLSDLSTEPEHVMRAYGADDPNDPLKAAFARNCILARRLIEQGVRFVQLFNGAYQTGGEGVSNWDGHKDLERQYTQHGRVLDQPVGALLADLKQRGLLEDTLVVWCTEFGRMPTFQKGASGRDHNPAGFTCWMAGAGVKAPFSYGATDEFSHRAVENVVDVHDFHATILHLLGLNHERLTYYHNGIQRRLTDVHGHVVSAILR